MNIIELFMTRPVFHGPVKGNCERSVCQVHDTRIRYKHVNHTFNAKSNKRDICATHLGLLNAKPPCHHY